MQVRGCGEKETGAPEGLRVLTNTGEMFFFSTWQVRNLGLRGRKEVSLLTVGTGLGILELKDRPAE